MEDANSFRELISTMPLFFKIVGGLLFVVVVGGFLYVIIKGLFIWFSNNNAEVVRKIGKIVDKRTEVWGGSGDSSANTDHYITLEFDDTNRVELYVKPINLDYL